MSKKLTIERVKGGVRLSVENPDAETVTQLLTDNEIKSLISVLQMALNTHEGDLKLALNLPSS